MPISNLLDNILHALEISSIFRNPHRVQSAHSHTSLTIEGEVRVEGIETILGFELDTNFPIHLPRFYLQPWDSLGFIPHVEMNGTICFADPEGLLLDRHEPVAIVLEALQRVLKVLEHGVAGQNHKDFVEEFEAYWSRIKGLTSIVSIVQPINEICDVIVVTDHATKAVYIANSEQDVNSFENRTNSNGRFTIEKGLYIPLPDETFIIPPRPDKPFWTPEEIRQLLMTNLAEKDQKKLSKLLKRRHRHTKYVITKLPRFSEGESLFGFKYEQIRNKHPLLEDHPSTRVIPILLERADQTYLIRRGGGNDYLSKKQVLLVGCGAVGGFLAFELARAGISHIALVDSDVLRPENTYRHILGRKYWGKFKVHALKHEIETQLPYMHLKTFTLSIEQLLNDKILDLFSFDLLVFATGNPTVELHINEQIHTNQNRLPTVFTWLEPLGIGGHALLVNNSSHGGCLQCLYTSTIDDDMTLENRASFATPGQSFGRALSGCGSLFTPYASMDADRTATMAARLAIDALTHREIANPLHSWKGDASLFLEQGFQLSNRYYILDSELFRSRYAYQTARCPICGAEKSL